MSRKTVKENSDQINHISIENSNRLSLALEMTSDGLWDWNIQTGSINCSPRFWTMLGYLPDEFEPFYQSWTPLLHPEDRQFLEDNLAQNLKEKGTIFQHEYRIKTKEGNWRWIQTRGKVLEWDSQGNPTRMVGTHTDITERKTAEIDLRGNEEKYRNIVENCTVGIALIDQNGQIWEWNSTLESISGIEKKEALKKQIWEIHYDLLPPEKKYTANYGHYKKLATELIEQSPFISSYQQEVTIHSKEGITKDLVISFFSFITNQTKMVGCIIRDITLKNQIQAALKLYKMAIEESEDLILAADKEYHYIFVNQAYLNYYKIQSADVIGKQVHEIVGEPVFTNYIKSHFDACLQGKTAHTHFQRQYPDMGTRWMNTVYYPLHGADGTITGAVVMMRDCTEQIRSEKEQSILVEQLQEAITDGIVTLDDKGAILHLNESAKKLLSIHKQEIISRKFYAIIPPEFQFVAKILEHAIRTDEFVREKEIGGILSDGRRWTYSLNVTPLHSGSTNQTILIIRDISRLRQLEQEISKHITFKKIIGKSAVMTKIFYIIRNLADLPTTVLIEGESGTGKELVASALHEEGCRRSQPFIRVNCAALPESLLETELFGHVRGAFTGATQNKPGRFELANHGTIFLDEIGDVTPKLQLRLLRVLQEQELERVGSTKIIKIDVRVIAATNRNVKELVEKGIFREDLYYRLNVVRVVLPPLRERRDDIPLLTEHFLNQLQKRTGRKLKEIDPAAMQFILDYSWPGNVRQLENSLEHALVLCRDGIILPENLPPEITENPHKSLASPTQRSPSLNREQLHEVLNSVGWNRSIAAKKLGISRTTLWRLMREMDLNERIT